jgi:large subunit ribosomal protein L22
MEAVAKYKNCPLSPRKMRLVVDNIRGLEVGQALDILRFTRKEAAYFVEKTLLSAVANWENKVGYVNSDDYELVVKTAFVDQGPTLKRFQSAPHGRAHRILKRSNHLTIVVENKLQMDDNIGEEE